jgi:predicted nucleic acid-binding protein
LSRNYLAEAHPTSGERLAQAILQAGQAQFAISPLVKCECLVGPIKRADPVLLRAYSELFGLMMVSLPMPESVYLQAAEFRGRFGLRTPDALHLACAQHHGCEALWTNDDRLTKGSNGLARNIVS